jgi:hypothetical protein
MNNQRDIARFLTTESVYVEHPLTHIFKKLHLTTLSHIYVSILFHRSDGVDFIITLMTAIRILDEGENKMLEMVDVLKQYETSEIQDRFEVFFDTWLIRSSMYFVLTTMPEPILADLVVHVVRSLLILPLPDCQRWMRAIRERNKDFFLDAIFRMIEDEEENK